jgi:hypothetical protein
MPLVCMGGGVGVRGVAVYVVFCRFLYLIFSFTLLHCKCLFSSPTSLYLLFLYKLLSVIDSL